MDDDRDDRRRRWLFHEAQSRGRAERRGGGRRLRCARVSPGASGASFRAETWIRRRLRAYIAVMSSGCNARHCPLTSRFMQNRRASSIAFFDRRDLSVELFLVDLLENLADARARRQTKLQQVTAEEQRRRRLVLDAERARALEKPVHRRAVERRRCVPGNRRAPGAPAAPGRLSAPAAGRRRRRRSAPCGTCPASDDCATRPTTCARTSKPSMRVDVQSIEQRSVGSTPACS